MTGLVVFRNVRMRMRIRFILAAGVLLVAAPAFCAGEDTGIADSIQAVVSDTPITQQQVEKFTAPDEELLMEQFGNQFDTLRKKVIALRTQGLDFLIVRQVILQDYKKNLKIPESIMDEVVQDRIKERYHGDNVKLTKDLEAQGLTKEQFKQQLREQFIVEIMRDHFVKDPIISPKKVEDYYMAHRNDFKLEDQIRMRMIVLKKGSHDSPEEIEQTRKRAGEILSQLKGGASFAELARSYSDGSNARDGGDTGWEDVAVINKALVENVNKLKAGEFSEVIEAPDAFYLLKLEDRHPAHYKPLNDVRLEIEKILTAKEITRLQDQWVNRLKSKTFIRYE